MEKALPPVLLHYVMKMAWDARSSIVHAFQNEENILYNNRLTRGHTLYVSSTSNNLEWHSLSNAFDASINKT